MRYPNLGRREDSRYRDQLARVLALGMPDVPHSHLFIRCFHGANTWERRHFTDRLHRTAGDWLAWLAARWVRRDVRTHPRFRLTELERAAFELFLADSREAGLFR